MGNDGGTIAKKGDILLLYTLDGNKNQQTKFDDNESLFSTCSLSSLPLKDQPLMSDYKGKLYLKEKILEFLLNKDDSSKLEHIKTLNDLVTLKAFWDSEGRMICPVTQKSTQLAYLRSCGCVLSHKLLKEASGVSTDCPSCATAFNTDDDIVILNPHLNLQIDNINEESYKLLQERSLNHSKKPVGKKKKQKSGRISKLKLKKSSQTPKGVVAK